MADTLGESAFAIEDWGGGVLCAQAALKENDYSHLSIDIRVYYLLIRIAFFSAVPL